MSVECTTSIKAFVMCDQKEFRSRFLNLLGDMPSDSERRSFLSWIRTEVSSTMESSAIESTDYAELVTARSKLHEISEYVMELVPNTDAIFPSEIVTFPTSLAADDDENLNKENTIHVDAFLYDEAVEEEMVEAGILPTAFCKDCGSKEIQNYTYITHSCSKFTIENIFTTLLPPLPTEAVILDVGSRLGAVLYGAYLLTRAKCLIGVEMNKELCHLQSQVCNRFGFNDRVQIHCSEMTTRMDLFQQADVVILNNVFEFFISEEGGARAAMWKFLRKAMRPGTLVVCSPPIDKSISKIDTGIDVHSWVEEISPFRTTAERVKDPEKGEDIAEFYLYKVIK